MRLNILVLILSLFLVDSVAAGDDSNLRLTPTHITAFKNGLSWIVAEGRGAPDDTGSLTLAEPLHALYGSLHLSTRDGVAIRSAVATEVSTPRPPRDLMEMARAYRGRKVGLRTSTGLVHGVLQDLILMPDGGHGFVLGAEKARVIIPYREVVELNLWGPTNLTDAEDRTRVLRITFDIPGDKVHVVTEYLTDRFGWLPEYRIDTSEPRKAALHMDAYVLNDLANLSGTEVFLATGVARFDQNTMPTPLEQMGSVSRVLQRLTACTWGLEQEDTFLYGPLDLDLDRGERGRFPVLRRQVPYEDLFYWEVDDGSLDPVEPPPVWLAVQLTNTTPGPLTTGPVTVVEGGKAVGQGLLTFTAAGDEAVVKVSRSKRVLGTVQEIEVDRARRAEKIAGQYMDRVILEGTLVVRNTSARKARVRVVRRLTGVLEQSSKGGKVREVMLASGAINPDTTVTWDLTLAAAEERVLAYRYKVRLYED